MDKDLIYEYFIEILKEKIPERGKLANTLSNMLFLEKEAVYRRLRGEVPFTFSEIAVIAKEMDISLDNTIGTNSSKNRPFQMRLINFEKPAEQDYVMQQHYADMLEEATKDPQAETATASNLVPINLCIQYEDLYRFHRFKWLYQFGSKPSKLKDVVLAERLKKMNQKTIRNTKEIANTYYIWDEQIIPSLINDILYFESIRLIEKEEVAALKEDIIALLSDLEKTAISGQNKETGTNVYLFVASISFETSFSYIQAKDLYLTDIRSFTLNDTVSLDKQVFVTIKKWMQSLIRTSTLISGSNEVQRILFFEKQKEYINQLL